MFVIPTELVMKEACFRSFRIWVDMWKILIDLLALHGSLLTGKVRAADAEQRTEIAMYSHFIDGSRTPMQHIRTLERALR